MNKLYFTFVLVFLMLFTAVACSQQETITDNQTKLELEKVDISQNMIVHHALSDGMDRGKHEYWDKDVVVDTKFYSENEIQRGDVILYKIPKQHVSNPKFDKQVSRIVGLSGEKIKIVDGQVYINDKKLDTFYGKAMSRGEDKETYLKTADPKYTNIEAMKDYFETNMNEVQIPDGSVYIMDDTWWRGVHSQQFGPLSKAEIIGKVIGYKKN